MNMNEIILKKRNGKELREKEINYVIENYTLGKIPDYQMSAFLMTNYYVDMTDYEIFHLTQAMINSGITLDLSKIKGVTVDKHSTGGVGDKISLIAGPIAAAGGCKVVKMSGRGLGFTGGTIDKLQSIPGFTTDISLEKFIDNVNKIGISIISQKSNIAVADKMIYALRDVTGTVDIKGLIASSIMSKKLAVNADALVIDVKYGSGAMMKNYNKAVELGETMRKIALKKGKKIEVVYSDMNQPLGREIGNRNEIIEVIETLKGRGEDNLTEEALYIAGKMIWLSGCAKDFYRGREIAVDVLKSGKALDKFGQLVEIQGGNPKVIDDYKIMGEPKNTLKVMGKDLPIEKGVIKQIDAEKIAWASVKSGAGRITKEDIIDYSAGVTLCRLSGESYDENTVLAKIHGNDISKVKMGLSELINAFKRE